MTALKYTDSHKWIKGNCSFPIADIQEVRTGWNTAIFDSVAKSSSNALDERQCFSLVMGNNYVTLDLAADSPETRDRWVAALQTLVKRHTSASLKKQHYLYLKEHFIKADSDKNKRLGFDEIQSLLKQMNISIDKKNAKRMFERADKNRNGNLDVVEFVDFYERLLVRPDIDQIITSFTAADDANFLDAVDLQRFLQQSQKVEFSLDDCRMLINNHEVQPTFKKEGFLSSDGLSRYC
ncbi:PREDICTED: 1-phosphatidylinositol 4,5-bisphosphate phosphodiesterase delta-4-like [Priapulus caudatus]|uniref:1-phosphatidylinositol 4,5-bisphosphate phosphodiesterase delta-4-like n=1 Tax=Priapulus caudatus TaxID=37621 RepID=A0ABM1ETA4_PRICU|nr:PREDICTED: 1-phosphatidylinositol 4,5-bisphosphate phosphodiesterase delta-4-like [Priapulus caudatus]